VSRRHWEAWAREAAPAERELTVTEAHVLIALASYADAAGECYPSLTTLAAAVRRGERETTRALSGLQAVGLIERRGRGPGRTRLTRLDPDPRPAAGQQTRGPPRAKKTRGPPRSSLTRGAPRPRLATRRDQNLRPTAPRTPRGNPQQNQNPPPPTRLVARAYATA
jgi:hypothetical protein